MTASEAEWLDPFIAELEKEVQRIEADTALQKYEEAKQRYPNSKLTL
jgi:hypothetical protein